MVTRILQQIRDIRDGKQSDMVATRDQCILALEFVNLVITSLVINKATATIVVRLYGLSRTSEIADKLRASTKAHIKSMRGTWYQDIHGEIEKLEATPRPS